MQRLNGVNNTNDLLAVYFSLVSFNTMNIMDHNKNKKKISRVAIRLISRSAESAISIMPATWKLIYLVMISVYRMLPINVELKVSLAKRVVGDSNF